MSTERFDTVIVGGGQAGLAMGYQLAQRRRPFVILEANERIGDSWRRRWDSLRLFTPARYDGLPGLPFPAPGWSFPSRDQFADYLRDYAARWELPVRTGIAVQRLWHDGARYVVEAGDCRFGAGNVVVAAGYDHIPRIPGFAAELDPGIVQSHATDYRNPAQLRDGDVLVVGAGNSGADIALELSRTHRVLLSGRHPGQIPWRIDRWYARLLSPLMLFAFTHVLTVRTPIGRGYWRTAARSSGSSPRTSPPSASSGWRARQPCVTGCRYSPTAVCRMPDVANVVWSTGFRPDTSWIDLPVFGADGEPAQRRGIVDTQPGLYFLGRLFQYSLASSMIHGVGREAEHIARHIAARAGHPRAQASATTAPRDD